MSKRNREVEAQAVEEPHAEDEKDLVFDLEWACSQHDDTMFSHNTIHCLKAVVRKNRTRRSPRGKFNRIGYVNTPNNDEFLTRWSIVANVSDENAEVRTQAIGELWVMYEPLLRRYLKYQKLGENECDEVLGEFAANKVIEGKLFEKADPKKGRLRTFLKACLHNMLLDWLRRQDRMMECQQLEEPDASEANDLIFDREWARSLVVNSLSAMRDECQRKQQDAIWNIFYHRIITQLVFDVPIRTFKELAADHGLSSEHEARNKLVQANRKFQRLLRQMVLETLNDGSDVDEEMERLWQAVKQFGPEMIERGGRDNPALLDSSLSGSSELDETSWASLDFEDSARLHELTLTNDADNLRAALEDELQRTLSELVDDQRRSKRHKYQPLAEESSMTLHSTVMGPSHLDSLTFARKYFKSRFNRSKKKDVIASALYHALWAASWLEHGTLQTKLDLDALRRSWTHLSTAEWLTESIRQRLLDARAKLEEIQPGETTN